MLSNDAFTTREPVKGDLEQSLELELWMINSRRQLKDLVSIMSQHQLALRKVPAKLRRTLRKEVNKVEALLASATKVKKKKKRKTPVTDKQKERRRITLEHDLKQLQAHIEVQDQVHKNTLQQFSKERDALENKIRAQRRVIEQVMNKSSDDKQMLTQIIHTMHREQDDEAWPPKLFLPHEMNQWNNRIYDAPQTQTTRKQVPIHIPLNFTPKNVALWRRYPKLLPNLIALQMYSESSQNAVCNIHVEPKDYYYAGLHLVRDGGAKCKRAVVFHMRNEHLGAGRVQIYVSFDGMCSKVWLSPETNAETFGTMLIRGLESVENRSARDGSVKIVWDLVFTPGGRMSIEMCADGGDQRISLSPMKSANLVSTPQRKTASSVESEDRTPPSIDSFQGYDDAGAMSWAEQGGGEDNRYRGSDDSSGDNTGKFSGSSHHEKFFQGKTRWYD
eukprot:g6559.t1